MRLNKESLGDMSVEEFFNEFAMVKTGRRKYLDTKLLDTYVSGLSEFLAKRYRKMTPEEFVNLPMGTKADNMLSEYANWLKKNKGVDLYENFDDYYELNDTDGSGEGYGVMEEPDASELNGRTRWGESRHDLDEGRITRTEIIDCIENYVQARIDKENGDRTAGMAARIAYDKLNKMLDEIM